MDLARLSDDDLLLATPGRPEAFGELYARHEAAILGFMLRRTGEPELAADLAAETFAAALVSVRRFRPGPAPAAAWLYGIARHVLLRSLKRRRVEDRARRRLAMPALTLTDDLLERIERIGGDGLYVPLDEAPVAASWIDPDGRRQEIELPAIRLPEP